MKKAIKLVALLLLVVSSSVQAQNLLSNPGFETDPTTYTVSNELWRVANFYDDSTQTENPAMTAADISAGGVWVKKHPSSGYFKATVSTSNVYSGTRCLNMYIGAGSSQTGMGDWTNMVNLQRISSVSNSRIYKASVWARVDATSPNVCTSITMFITDNTLRTNLTSTISLTGGTTWTKYEATFDIPTFVAANPTANFATAFFGVGITTTYDGASKTNYSGVLLDDYSLEAVTIPTDYFRTSASGNWSDLNTWQSSFDNATWISPTLTPTAEAASIYIQNGHEITVDATATASSLTVNAGGKLTLNAGEALTTNELNIESNAGNGTGTFVDKGGTLTIYSTNNLLQNPGFEADPADYTVSNELWRVETFQDNTTQTTNPAMSEAANVSAGGIWIKKHINTAYLKSTIITTNKKSGAYSLNMYIQSDAIASLNMENWENLVNMQRINVPLSNSKKYRATVWARADATAGNVCDKITFFLTDNTNKVNMTSVVNLTGGTAWTQYEAIFDIPTFVAANPTSDFTTAFFGIGIQSTLQSGDNTKYNYSGVLLDNYTLTELTNTASVNQYLNSARSWYISSPMSNAVAPSGYTYYKHHEPGDNAGYSAPATAYWESINSGTTLTAGTGYIARLASGPATFIFSGILNTGNKDVTLTRSASGGFNLVGNPYPSYLYINDLASNTDLEASYWIRSYNSGYVFDTYNIPSAMSTGLSGLSLTSKIPPMQAFWLRVKEDSTSASVTFTNAMRFHQDDANNKFRAPKSSNTDRQVVRLQVSNGVRVDETVLYTHSEASNQFDIYDSEKMSNNSVSIPEIYTLASDEQLAINGLNSIPYNTEISLGFKTGETNTFTLKASQLTNFTSETQIILKDYLNPNNVTEYNLSDGSSYVFSSEAVSTNDRFKILIKAPSQVTGNQLLNQNESEKLNAYKNANNKITVHYSGEINNSYEISVFNALGQQLAKKALNSSTVVFDDNFPNGVYIIKLSNVQLNFSKKLIVD